MNLVLIGRNTKIPSQGVRVLETLEEQQSRLRVRVTQGEGEDVDFVTELIEVLARRNVTPIPVRADFDASLHQAVGVDERSEEPAGTVTARVRRGWLSGARQFCGRSRSWSARAGQTVLDLWLSIQAPS